MSDPTVSTYWNQTTPAPDSGMQPAVIKSDNATPQDSRTISVPNTGGAVPKTANYTAVAADCGKLLSFNSASALTYTLPATPPSVGANQWEVGAECIGTGGLTVAATSGAKLDGVVGGTLALAQNSGCRIFTDGTDYYTQRGSAGTLTLKHNGTLNGSQTTLDTKAGTGIAITDDGVGGLTFAVQSVAVPVIRGHSSGTTMSGGVQGQSNQLVATFPTGTLAGDLCVVDAAHAYNLSVPSGWTSAYWFTGGAWNGGAIYKVLTSGDIATGSVTISAANTWGGNWSAVSFIGPTGGVREAQGTVGAGFSGTTTLTTSSAVLGTDAAVLFGATRDTGSGTATISISPGTALDTTPLTYATFCEGELADLGMTGGAQTISYTYANQTAFLLAQVIVEGVTTVGTGSVTSVAATVPSDFAVTVTNPTTTPLIAITGGPTKSAIQQEAYTYAADTGAANAYAVTLSPAPTLVAGSVVCFKAANANTGASTLAVNGGAATAIKKNGNSTALASGDIAAGQIIDATYDGAVWQILVPGSGGSSFITSITTTGTSGPATVVSGVLNVPQYSGGAGGGSAVEHISTLTPTGTGTVTFSSLGSYEDLIVVVRGASTASASFSEVHLQFNGDTGGNYDLEPATVNNTTLAPSPVLAGTYLHIGWVPAATGVASMGAASECTIYDYAGTTFQKAIVARSGIKLANAVASFYTTDNSGWWRNTAAITSVTVFLAVGNYAAGSSVSLYGRKASGSGGGATAPTLRGTGIQASNTAAPVVTFPTGTVAGDMAVVFVGGGFGISSTPAGWSLIDNLTGSNWNASTFVKSLVASDIATGSVTIPMTASFDVATAIATFVGTPVGFRGLSSSRNASGSATITQTFGLSSLLEFPSANDMVLYFGSNRAASTDTVSLGSMLRQVNDGASASACLYNQTLTVGGEISPVFQYSVPGTGNYQCVLIVRGS